LLAPGIRACPNVLGNPYSPTTRAMLEELASQPMPETVLDIGSGNGILGLAAKALGAKTVHCYDNNPFCNETAQLNVAANKRGRSVHLNTQDVLTVTLPKCGLLICTVDDTDVIASIIERTPACLDPGGLVLSLVQDAAAAEVGAWATAAGLEKAASKSIVGGYRAMSFRRT
jgi:ribosomal protein L11 methylase PrmA